MPDATTTTDTTKADSARDSTITAIQTSAEAISTSARECFEIAHRRLQAGDASADWWLKSAIGSQERAASSYALAREVLVGGAA